MERQAIQTPDRRQLCVYDAGDPAGPAILYHHGTPSSGLLDEPWIEDARGRGARLIGFDRPGYGGSTRSSRAVGRGRRRRRRGHPRRARDRPLRHLGHLRRRPARARLRGAPAGPDRRRGDARVRRALRRGRARLARRHGRGQPPRVRGGARGRRDARPVADRGARRDDGRGARRARRRDAPASERGRRGLPDRAVGGVAVEESRAGIGESIAGWRDDDYAFLAPWGFELASSARRRYSGRGATT